MLYIIRTSKIYLVACFKLFPYAYFDIEKRPVKVQCTTSINTSAKQKLKILLTVKNARSWRILEVLQ